MEQEINNEELDDDSIKYLYQLKLEELLKKNNIDENNMK